MFVRFWNTYAEHLMEVIKLNAVVVIHEGVVEKKWIDAKP